MTVNTRKIAAVLAHPDDETFIFGGTIAHYAKAGVQVKIVSATKGEMGRRMGNPPFITRESMPIVREQELRDACRILGAEPPLFFGIRDKTVEFENFEALTLRIVRFIREYRPDVLLTFHERRGGHPDHCAIGKAATEAFRRAADPQYDKDSGVYAVPRLYFISFGDSMKQPERYGLSRADIVRIDVSDSLQEKLHAFRAHRTQTELDESLWKPDREALNRFGRYEYFIIGDGKPNQHEDLFG